MQKRRFTVFQFSVLTLAGLIIWFSRVPPEFAEQASLSVPYVGFTAPDFEVTTLDGRQVKLSDFRGSPVVLNFWASWCPPCRAEMPAFQQVFEEYRDAGLVLLAVNATHLDSQLAVNNFIQEFNLMLPVYLDAQGDAFELYQVRAMPSTYFIGADGKIKDIEFGGPLSAATIRLKVDDLLRSRKAP